MEQDLYYSNMEEHAPLSSNLVLTKKTEVPMYLQSGEFYKSLNDDDDEQISVPAHTLKPNALVENNNDLEYLLSSLRFWSVDKVLPEMVNYCLYKNPTSCVAVLETFKADFRYVDIIMQAITLEEEERAKLAIHSGLLDLVTILRESCCALPDGCHIAARAGHLDILLFLHEHGGKLDTKVKLVCADGKDFPPTSACSHAAAGGNLTCLEYLHKCVGSCWDRGDLSPAIYEGQTACVEYALQHGCPISMNDGYSSLAARKGNLDILRLLHAAGVPWCFETSSEAAKYGHLHCLQFAHESGCIWNVSTCSYAAMNGHLECLMYAHQNGCPWFTVTASCAAGYGHLHCLEYIHENGGPWDPYTCAEAARGGHLDCLRYAHEHGCEWNEYTCYHAAKSGKLKCLKYAHENGCHWNEDVCRNAAGEGHLECLQYAHEHGCAWYEDTCLLAAKNGHLECLKYAHEHGCRWDEETLTLSARKGHLHCLQYAHEQGCPVGANLYKAAVQVKQVACAEYIKLHIN